MTEQELIQENEKLKGRLAKAIEVFKEQKEIILTLTADRDKAKAEVDEQAVKVQKLEERLAEKSENDDKFFEQEEEISKLNSELDKRKMESDAMAKGIEGLKSNLEVKNQELADLTEVSKNQAKNIADRDKIIDELRVTVSRHVEKAGSMTKEIENLNKCLEQRSNELSRAKKERDELDIDLKALQEENEVLKKDTEEQHERIENLSNALDKAHENLEQEQKNTDVLLTNLENCFKEGLSILKDNR